MHQITIFTPTYNRAEKLKRLYVSLCHQTELEFTWLIVDDGSLDNTEELVNSFATEGIVDIEYVKKENGGKISAYIEAISRIKTRYYICVDSDDTLSENAVQIMNCCLSEIDRTDSDNKIIGVIFPQRLKGDNSSCEFPKREAVINIMDLKYVFGVKESALLIETEAIKKIKIPIIRNERFLSEEIIYNNLSAVGKFITCNKPFYISEYQCDGITNNVFSVWKNNPFGTYKLLNSRMEASKKLAFPYNIVNFVKAKLLINAFDRCKLADYSEREKDIMDILLWGPSYFVYRKFFTE